MVGRASCVRCDGRGTHGTGVSSFGVQRSKHSVVRIEHARGQQRREGSRRPRTKFVTAETASCATLSSSCAMASAADCSASCHAHKERVENDKRNKNVVEMSAECWASPQLHGSFPCTLGLGLGWVLVLPPTKPLTATSALVAVLAACLRVVLPVPAVGAVSREICMRMVSSCRRRRQRRRRHGGECGVAIRFRLAEKHGDFARNPMQRMPRPPLPW